MSVGESLGSHSLHSFAEFLQHHINSPETNSCLTNRRKLLHVLKPFSLNFMATKKSVRKGGRQQRRGIAKDLPPDLLKCTRPILKRITISGKLKSNGFEDIGQSNGSSTGSWPRNMLKRMPSSDPGEIFCTIIFNPGPRLKLLSKASILAWCADHILRMLTRLHCSGVMKTVCSSATTSSPKTQLQRTRRN